MTKEYIAHIESNGKGWYSVYCEEQFPFGFFGEGATIEEAKASGSTGLVKFLFSKGSKGITEILNNVDCVPEFIKKLAIKQLTGGLTNLITNLRQKIIEILANIEVNIDYPEYEDIEVMTNKKISLVINDIENQINKILKESKNGQLIKTGIKTVIVGKPNVGKSSILNNLLEEDQLDYNAIEILSKCQYNCIRKYLAEELREEI